MQLTVRPRVYVLPSYSLTGDLLGFLRCGLQYRYTRIGQLPATRPVQMWFGQFIHAVLEEAYRRYDESRKRGVPDLPPWPSERLEEIRNLVKARLAAQGLFAYGPDLERLGDERADACIQQLGPYLFPLIHRAEVRLTGTRPLPSVPAHLRFREADRYEMAGVVDVVTHVELADPSLKGNLVLREVVRSLPKQLPPEFEIVVDYKGMRRPPKAPGKHGVPSLWDQHEWQVLTYADLRRRQSGALPVAAGLLVYVNEIFPTKEDLKLLKEEIAAGTTDVVPLPGSEAEILLNRWREKDDPPDLPFEFRLARMLRVVPVTERAIKTAGRRFDEVVRRIEVCRGEELKGKPVREAWEKNASDDDTCVVCDWRTTCPEWRKKHGGKKVRLDPQLPGVRS